jgi:hypothetical protein
VSAARQVLERLLRRAESARRRGAVEQVSLRMASVAEYTALRSLAELDDFHAAIVLAERDGAIAAQRVSRSGDGSRLLRIGVADLAALARHLGVELLDDRVAQASRRLQPWRERFPIIGEVLETWRASRKLRGHGPEVAVDVADAARAVAARLDDAGNERILRRESVRLFGDSKRLEKLTPWLEILATGELAASGLLKDEVWSAIGLRREPQPLLLAGVGSVRLDNVSLPLLHPFLGLPVESVQSVATAARCLLTIENLASFHDAARSPGAASALLLYTGGMPSPAWRAAYARILRSLATATPVFHWGDIDEGGFRIAAVLAATARDAGHALQPWLMSPEALPATMIDDAAAPDPAALAAMQRWATRAGWPQVAEALARRPLRLEQETLDPALPCMDSSHLG